MSAKTISPGLIKHEIESINAVQRLIGSKRHPLERGSLMREVSAQRCQTLGNFNELCTVSLHLRKSLQWPSPLCACRLGWRVAAVALVWLLCDVSLSFLSARQLSRYALVICRSHANLPARSLAAHCLCAFSSIYAPCSPLRCQGLFSFSESTQKSVVGRRSEMRNCVCLTSANDGLIKESPGLTGETDVWSIGNMKLGVFCAGVRRSASCKWAGSLHPTAAMPVEARLISMSFTFTGGKWLINHVAIYHLITVDSGTCLRVFTPHLCSCACIFFKNLFFFTEGLNGWASPASCLLPRLPPTTWVWCEMSCSTSTCPLVRGL